MSYVHSGEFERELNKLRITAKFLERALRASAKTINASHRERLAEVAGNITCMAEAAQCSVIAHNRVTERRQNSEKGTL